MNTPAIAPTPAFEETKRDALRARIEASEQRIAERTIMDDARDAAQSAADYTRAHPGTVVAGALALGLVIGLLTTPGRRVAASAAARVRGRETNAASKNASKLAALFANVFATHGMRLLEDVLEGANTGRDRLDDLAGKAADEAQRLASGAAETSGDLARRTRKRAADVARDVAERLDT